MDTRLLDGAMTAIRNGEGLHQQETLQTFSANRIELLPKNRPVTNIWSSEFVWCSPEVKSKVSEYWKRIPNPNIGMFLQGTAGTGKTTIAVNICNEWKIKAPIAHIGAFDFFEILTAAKTFQEQRTAQQEAILWNLQNSRYDLLVIDDFATGRITEAAADVIEIMVRTWEKKGLTVIFTTNVNPDKIVEMFNEQLWSRICGMTAYVELTGNDWRVR